MKNNIHLDLVNIANQLARAMEDDSKKEGMAKSFQQRESPKETVPNLFCLTVKKKKKEKKNCLPVEFAKPRVQHWLSESLPLWQATNNGVAWFPPSQLSLESANTLESSSLF